MPQVNDQKVILVTGMHRSGTSALMAGIHQVLGVPVGDTSEERNAEDNPKGFFENSKVIALSDEVLESLGTTWDCFSFQKPLDFPEASFKPFRQRARSLVKEFFNNNFIWGIKDPRFSVLMPFWDDIFKGFHLDIFRVIALRHPFEVALSQKKRHYGFPEFHLCGKDLRYTLNLWFWYNFRLLKDLPDDNNIVVSFDALLDDPATQMHRIGQLIELDSDPNGLDKYANSFLEIRLKHHNVNDLDIKPYLTEYGHVFELHERMKLFGSKDRLSKMEVQNLLEGMPDDRIFQSWTAPIYSYVNNVKVKLSQSQTQTVNLQQQKNDMEKQLSEFVSQVQQLQGMCTQFEQAIRNLELKVTQKDQSLQKASCSLSALQQKVKDLEGVVSQKDRSLQEASCSLSALQQKVKDLEGVVSQKDRSLQEASCSLSALQQKVKDLEGVVSQKDRSLQEASCSLSALQQKVKDLEGVVSQKDRSLQEASCSLSALQQKVKDLEGVVSQKDRSLQEASCSLSALQQKVKDLEGVVSQKDRSLQEASCSLSALQQKVEDFEEVVFQKDLLIQERDKVISAYREELYSVYTSKSWRLMLPMRKMGTLARRALLILHCPCLRARIKQVYLLLPPSIRYSRLIKKLKNRFKNKEKLYRNQI